MKGEQQIAGLWCRDVLDRLYDYLDDQLPSDERDKVEAHLSGCSLCASFGGDAGAVAKAVQKKLVDPAPVSEDLQERLLAVADTVRE